MNKDNEREILQCRRLAAPHAECKCEFSLPDYLGDVRRILLTDAKVRGAGRFADADGAEFPGIVVFDVVYLDAEGEIRSVSFSGDYDMRVRHSCSEGAELILDPELESYTIRLPGPRKLSAKAAVSGRAYAMEALRSEVAGTAMCASGALQTLTESVLAEGMRRSPAVEREYAESLAHLDGAIVDEVQVMYPTAEVRCDAVCMTDEGALVKGELRTSAILKNGDEPAFSVSRVIPLEQTIPFESYKGGELTPWATVTSVTHAVNADEGGSEVVASVIVELYLDELYNQQTEVVTDAYMTECVTENIYEDLDSSRFEGVVRERFGCQGEIGRRELDAPNLREIVCMRSEARIDNCEWEKDGVKVEGRVQFFGVCSATGEDGNVSYVGVKMESQFAKNVNVSCQNTENTLLEPRIFTHDCSGVIDAEKVYASCEACMEIRMSSQGSLRALSVCNARTDLPFSKDKATVVAYYPVEGESLYSIAKRFHTTTAAIAEANTLSEATVSGGGEPLSGERLLIYW